MDVIIKINKALQEKEKDTGKANGILQFGEFDVIKKIDKHSQQGVVLIASNKIKRNFAIKLCRPTADRNIRKENVKRFIREVTILASMSHKNIVKVYTGGTAQWDRSKWDLSKGFSTTLNANEYLYFVMDYIEGEDVSALFTRAAKNDGDLHNNKIFPANERLGQFEQMVLQVSQAIGYFHSKKITHKDIKPDNIRYSKFDQTYIVVDFGFARHTTSPSPKATITVKEYNDFKALQAEQWELYDIGQFSHMLSDILPFLKDDYDNGRYEAIQSTLKKGLDDNLKARYQTAEDFYKKLEPYFITLPQWKFELKLNEHLCTNRFGLFSQKQRLPVSGSVLFTEEIRDIIDSCEFQRLKGIKQLGPANFVYSGANHTRYEHSLGTYHLSLKYIEKLCNLPSFRDLCAPIDESIKLIVLSALLHDIGHYPYSHWIEEIEKFPNGAELPTHEKRARTIISDGAINKLIKEKWHISPEVISNLIANTGFTDDRFILINSLLNSLIDVDKIDYLVRDSVHCGVNYGEGLDTERLLDSLYIDPTSKKICLTDKGKSCLPSILTCRNIMYQEVYWHKTVRACDTMIKRFIYEYIRIGIDTVKAVADYLTHPDDYFMSIICSRAEEKKQHDLARLAHPFVYKSTSFKSRILYKPAYIFSERTLSPEKEETRAFFRHILDKKTFYSDMVAKSETLAKELKSSIPGIQLLDIIIDKTPVKDEHERYNLQGFRTWNVRKETWESFQEVLTALNLYLDNNMEAYIFCNPAYYDDMKRLANTGELDKILAEINNKS